MRYALDAVSIARRANVADSDATREVLATIEEMTAALNTGDADRLDSQVSNRAGCIHIGSDPDEW